jgi:D-alanyl-lipoteichoic acid acyltransferase DltB (MBOAT superfamily)
MNENAEYVFHLFGKEFHPVNLNIVLPIGLSFHTFQSMSYTIEVYRGNQKAERHLGYFANYVLFFPQMVAGPIEKYETLGNELKKKVTPLYDNFAVGFRLVLFGLFIKMAVADNLAPFVNTIYEDPSKYSSIEILMGLIFFSFQIYADFYGYSTIAVGAARMLGVHLITNFNTPYLAVNIIDFWKRWHISLTSWFRTYVYIPLGGSRVNTFRWTLNILIIFFISGLWHGASWTFVIWGLLHGVVYLVEHAFAKIFKFNPNPGFSFLNVLRIIKTFFVVTFIWIFFRAEDFSKAKTVIKSFLNNWSLPQHNMDIAYPLIFTGAIILLDILLYNKVTGEWLGSRPQPVRWALYTILLFGILCMSGIENLPFIYFQF